MTEGAVKKTKKYDTDAAARSGLVEGLKRLPEKWVQCRDMRHAWATLNDFRVVGRGVKNALQINRDLVCMRCETVRHEFYDQKSFGLDKTSQSYTYPEGYQLPGVPRGVKPSAIVQAEMYRRAMEKVAGAARGEREKGGDR